MAEINGFKAFGMRWGPFTLAGFITFLVLWTVGPLMRESDQAHMLEGALLLARDGQFIGRDFYNYDKQWALYLLLAPILSLLSLDEVGANPDSLVLVGNAVGAVVFLIGLLILAFISRWQNRSEVAVWLVVLFSPSLLLSSPLLSANIISAGFCFTLYAALLKGKDWSWLLLQSLLTCLAVGTRQDVVLLMPLICWGFAGESWRSLFSDRRCWALLLGSVTAITVGRFVSTQVIGMYPLVTNIQVISAYLVFGLGVALVVFVIVGFRLLLFRSGNMSLHVFGAVAVLLPILVYILQLYSPRHLVVAIVGLLSVSVFPEGRRIITTVPRWCSNIIVILTTMSLFVGLDLEQLSRPKLSFFEASEYPTADGYWPAGATLPFLFRLKDEVIDHNQKVWGCWKNVKSMEDRKVGVTALVTFGRLRYRTLVADSEEYMSSDVEEVGTMIEEVGFRRLLGREVNVMRSLNFQAAQSLKGQLQVAAEFGDIRLLEVTNTSAKLSAPVQASLAVAPFFCGEDYELVEFASLPKEIRWRMTVAVSEMEFRLEGAKNFVSSLDVKSGMHVLMFPDGIEGELHVKQARMPVYIAVRTLPQSFRKSK